MPTPSTSSSNKPLRIGLACGGTGGHIFPGLATAEVLRSVGHEVTLWMAGKDVEGEAVSGWKGRIITVPAQGFPNRFSLKGLQTMVRLFSAARHCRERMKPSPPDVLLAMGSYASVGPVYAARRLGVPVVLHEANVIPGRAVRLLSRWADCVAASFEETRYYLKRKQIVISGMPLRSELSASTGKSAFMELDPDCFTVLVMGGSRGAKRLNEVASDALCRLHAASGKSFQVIHLSGEAMKEEVAQRYKDAGVEARVLAFSQDMGAVYRASTLAVCRSGASTCAELNLFGIPSLLVPYPYAAGDHQAKNAEALERSGAADMVLESSLTQDWLLEYLANSLDSPERLARMREQSLKRSEHGGAKALASIVEQVGRGMDPSPDSQA